MRWETRFWFDPNDVSVKTQDSTLAQSLGDELVALSRGFSGFTLFDLVTVPFERMYRKDYPTLRGMLLKVGVNSGWELMYETRQKVFRRIFQSLYCTVTAVLNEDVVETEGTTLVKDLGRAFIPIPPKTDDEDTRFFFVLDFFMSQEDVDRFVEVKLNKVENILHSINDILESYDFVKEIVRVQPKPVEPTEQQSGQ